MRKEVTYDCSRFKYRDYKIKIVKYTGKNSDCIKDDYG